MSYRNRYRGIICQSISPNKGGKFADEMETVENMTGTKRGIDREFTVVLIAVSALCGLYLELFHEAVIEETGTAVGDATSLLHGGMSLAALPRVPLACLAILAVLCLLWHDGRAMRFLVRHRLLIGIGAVVVLTAAQISGSSIGGWAGVLGYERGQGCLFGTPRSIRSDEWVVSTPYAISQCATGLGAYNPVIRGVGADVTMVYGQPAWAVATIFRPFLWGYLILGASRGLAFFWSARLVTLFLITFETGLLVTRTSKREGDECLALTGAVLVTFAPIVQWWFAVNGTAELFVYGQGLVLALDRLLRSRARASRWGWSLLLAWLCGCYLLILYPAWQVPLFYVFAFMGLWVIDRYRQEFSHDERAATARRIAVPLVASLCLAMACVGLALYSSKETIAAVSQTAYPGKRDESGGGLLGFFGLAFVQMGTSLYPSAFTPNVCEDAQFISLFPMGLVLAIIELVRRRDKGLAFLLVPYVLLFVYGTTGLPHVLARVLLLSNVTTGRLPMALGYLDVIMLLRTVAVRGGEGPEKGPALGISAAFAALCVVVAHLTLPEAMPKWVLLVSLVFTWTMGYLALVSHRRAGEAKGEVGFVNKGLAVVVTVVMAIGLCVNPIQMGLGGLEGSDFARAVEQVRSEDPDALWVADDGQVGQALIMEGAKSYSGTHTYPALSVWRSIDPEGRYDAVYNRYARVRFDLSDTGETSFELLNPDEIVCRISLEDLETLHPSYWISSQDLTACGDENVVFERVSSAGPNLTIYKVRYA